jgi:hypothetical protein
VKMLDISGKSILGLVLRQEGRAAGGGTLEWRNITKPFMNCISRSV